MQEKLNQLSLGEKLVAGGGILFFIDMFLPWYKNSTTIEGLGTFSASANGFDDPGGFWSLLAMVIAVAMAGTIIALRFGNVQLPALGQFSWGQAYLAGAALMVLFLLLKLINESSYLSFGWFLGIVITGAIAYGCYLLYSADKGTGFNFSKS
ncbi:MAG: hypothetical protein AB7P33_18875 [Dehalococcoidia bacterium]